MVVPPNERELFLSAFASVRVAVIDRRLGREQYAGPPIGRTRPAASADRRHLAHSTPISRVEGHRFGRIQQAAAHSRDRICEWSRLSISPSGAVSSPGLDDGRFQSAVLR